jgi:hypothetical protein
MAARPTESAALAAWLYWICSDREGDLLEEDGLLEPLQHVAARLDAMARS